jgi:disulfide bond formation protein DsbB
MSDTTSWDMSQERQFIENLLSQRFNFFLVMFTVVLTGAATAKTQTKQTAILVLGFFLCFLVALTVYRIYAKLILILEMLHKTESHPVAIIGEKIKQRGLKGGFPANSLVGFYIPGFCVFILGIVALVSWCGCLKAI